MTALSPSQRFWSLTALIAAAFGLGVSMGVALPLTSLTLEVWQEPKWIIGLAGAVPSLAIFLCLPVVPRLVARTGAVRAILAGCIIGAAGFLALYLFQSTPAWIAIRFLMSAGLVLPWLVGETWLNTVTGDDTRGRVIASYAMSFFSGFLVGPVLLGQVGTSGLAPFVAGAVGTAFSGVPIILAARLAPNLEHDQATGVLSAFKLAPVGMASGFLGGFAEMTYLSLAANVGLAGGLDQGDALQLLSVIAFGGLALQLVIGWLADHASRIKVTIGLAAALIGLTLLLPSALGMPLFASAVAFLIGGVILGFYTLGLVIVGEQVSARDLAAANAAFLIMYQIGAILGPLTSGAAMTVSPVTGFVITVSIAVSVCTVVIVWLARR